MLQHRIIKILVSGGTSNILPKIYRLSFHISSQGQNISSLSRPQQRSIVIVRLPKFKPILRAVSAQCPTMKSVQQADLAATIHKPRRTLDVVQRISSKLSIILTSSYNTVAGYTKEKPKIGLYTRS